MELEWVQRVSLSPEKARAIREHAVAKGIALTVHGSYYINLNSAEPAKVEASVNRILEAARLGESAGARSLTFHAAFYGGDDPSQVFQRVRDRLREIVQTLKAEGVKIQIRPEVTGKLSQFGTLEEILNLCQEVEGVLPCVDFAHIHARTGGKWNTYAEFVDLLERLRKTLGPGALKDVHFHVSGIEYGPKGEKKHLMLEESDFNYLDLLRSFRDLEVEGVVICESPIPEKDALLLQRHYQELVKTGK